MDIVSHSNTKHRFFTSIIIFVIRWSNNFFIASLQTTTLIMLIGFLAIADINYLRGDVGFLFTPEFARFVKLLGVDISRGFNSDVFMSIIFRITFVVLILNTFAEWVMSSVFHKQINLLRVAFLQGTILITVLGLMALSSCFAPQAILGSETIASFVVFQWFIAMISFTGSILWSYLSGKLFSIFDKN